MSNEAVYIPDILEEIVGKVDTALFPTLEQRIYFMFGHPLEIVARLQELTKATGPSRGKKYPLVALFTDIPVVKDVNGFYGRAKLQMVIANITEQNLTAAQRLAKNFKPLLQPIKEELLLQISQHVQFTEPGELFYTEIERYYWGKNGLYGNTGNIFNDFIDCIELRDIQVTVKNKICTTIKNNL